MQKKYQSKSSRKWRLKFMHDSSLYAACSVDHKAECKQFFSFNIKHKKFTKFLEVTRREHNDRLTASTTKQV